MEWAKLNEAHIKHPIRDKKETVTSGKSEARPFSGLSSIWLSCLGAEVTPGNKGSFTVLLMSPNAAGVFFALSLASFLSIFGAKEWWIKKNSLHSH